MRAIMYTQYGPPDVLQVQQTEKPKPRHNEILIRVYATNVNYGDLTARNFRNISSKEFNMPMPLWFPAKLAFGLSKPRNPILGSEFSGKVEAIGNKVTRFKEGDAIFGYRGMGMGAYAEYLSMPESGVVVSKPENMSFEEAATVPYGSIMALNLLKRVNIQQNQKVLINGASGGMGSFAVQLAKHYGAEVTGVCGTQRVAYVKSLGAERVIDYTKEDFTAGDEVYDVIIDILGRSSFARCKKVLAENGRYLLASYKMKQVMQMVATSLTGGKKVICALLAEKVEDLQQIKKLVEAGQIKTIIDKRFPMEQAAEAHRYIENGQKKGNVVITVKS